MYKLLLLAVIIIFTVTCQNKSTQNQTGQKENNENVASENLANAQKAEIKIEGMTCTGCENAIQKTIKQFDGIYYTNADHEKGIAIVEFDSLKTDLAKLEKAINELGYETKGHSILTE